VIRKPRGLVKCLYEHTIHADLNAAMNILAPGEGKVPERVKVLSFIPSASRVVSVNGKEKNSNPAPRRGVTGGVRAIFLPRAGGEAYKVSMCCELWRKHACDRWFRALWFERSNVGSFRVLEKGG
jgi:hypothetical protein